ncbi:uncharacterized protein HMPREF1120_08851 [Exophiala dermatitidis NIH/UT8656]|uniref:Uncharacterized protein n=1 Tax=Exophiala dermatitidis (strain ATCC 34100 / CBS 525.76 / NIH/UT8656) TaxID=858893 RepID=H6CAW0_EXODN|nr:uncharacterized protein HMPREF1120_08851 [Exophiala dermatitidis NIH/UT8656]EHY60907.1 hypothetical protein HMPREF1120_08851 [Exophiala dermatitidis NIH/UT8656]
MDRPFDRQNMRREPNMALRKQFPNSSLRDQRGTWEKGVLGMYQWHLASHMHTRSFFQQHTRTSPLGVSRDAPTPQGAWSRDKSPEKQHGRQRRFVAPNPT